MNLTMSIFCVTRGGNDVEDAFDLTKCRIIFRNSRLLLLEDSIKFVSKLL